ncbi:CHAT domain-containing protein [Streptomyces sp. B21-083]|uniref:CHAT domain-containing protein n=1 Tax=Streptomyces sp. B21-083 TaxID=3039410 RepID=UPI002FEF702A
MEFVDRLSYVQRRLAQALASTDGMAVLDSPETYSAVEHLTRLCARPDEADGISVQERADAWLVLSNYHYFLFAWLPAGRDREALPGLLASGAELYRLAPERVPSGFLPLCGPFIARTSNPFDVHLWKVVAQRDLGHAMQGDHAELDRVIRLLHSVLLSRTPEDGSASNFVRDLGVAFLLKFEITRQGDDIREAIGYSAQAAAAIHDDVSLRGEYVGALSNSLKAWVSSLCTDEDFRYLEETISWLDPRNSNHAEPSLHAQAFLILLSLTAGRRYGFGAPGLAHVDSDFFGNLSAFLTECLAGTVTSGRLSWRIRLWTIICELARDDGGREAVECTFILALTYGVSYQAHGDTADLERAIAVGYEVLSLCRLDDPEAPRYWANLGDDLRTRHYLTGRASDIEEALAAGAASVTASAMHHDEAALHLSLYSASLKQAYRMLGKEHYLDASIERSRSAASLVRDGGALESRILTNLSHALQDRYLETGSPGDADEAVEHALRAVDAAAEDLFSQHIAFACLGEALQNRSVGTQRLSDLDDAIKYLVEAAKIARQFPPEMEHSAKSSEAVTRSNLTNALVTRFERTGDRRDLERAINESHRALDLVDSEDVPDLARMKSNLASAYSSIFRITRDRADIDMSIRLHKAALSDTSEESLLFSRHWANYAASLIERHRFTGELTDLQESVRSLEKALSFMDRGSLMGVRFSVAYCRALLALDGPSANAETLAKVSALLKGILDEGSGSLSSRIQCAHLLGVARIEAHDPQGAFEALRYALTLLPRLVPRWAVRQDAHHWLQDFAGLASLAAACAVVAGRTDEEALAVLESGRGILMAQALMVRGRLDELRREHPKLVERLMWLSNRLETDPALDSSSSLAEARLAVNGLRDREHRARLERDLEDVISSIRRIEGFSGFGTLPPLVEIMDSLPGTAAVVNVSEVGCDAFVVDAGRVVRVPLGGLTKERVEASAERFMRARMSLQGPDRSAEGRALSELKEVMTWCWRNVAEPVLRTVRRLHEDRHSEPEAPIRLWWVPTGTLSLLPLHAVGDYSSCGGEQGQENVLDQVISSYSPTLYSLSHHARNLPVRPSIEALHVGVVAMPFTPGHPVELPGSSVEARLLRGMFGAAVQTLAGEKAVNESVLAAISGSHVMHFACHSQTDPRNPGSSRLLLHDHRAHPLTMTQIAALRTDKSLLAFLSACSTSSTSAALADEFVHITGAFHVAGYPHVIGSLWPISDTLTPVLVYGFYKEAFRARGLPFADMAEALNKAINTLRRSIPDRPDIWAAYVHVGI